MSSALREGIWIPLCCALASCSPKSQQRDATPPSRAPRAPALESGYCERLQPELTRAVRAAGVGTALSCLDVPGVTELGRFGAERAPEEGSLEHCFDDPAEYRKLLQSSDSTFDLSIDREFVASAQRGAGASLGALVPWLPSVTVDGSRVEQLSARVALREARFVTLVGLASRLQGQRREQECLTALCKPGYTYVHKALIGVPTVTLAARDERGALAKLSAPLVSAEFEQRDVGAGARSLTSTRAVTLAIARSAFRTPQTERLCQFCGRRGQACCAGAPACDGGLGCIEQRCVEVGGPDQPCDGERCASGACVGGRCRTACGGLKQPCCPGGCSGALRCKTDPQSHLEPLLSSEVVRVSGGLLGTSEDRIFGSSSCGPLRRRGRFALTKLGSGRGECQKAWWFDPENVRDCRVAAHFEVSMLGSIECRLDVFAAPDEKPDRCLP